MNKGKRIAVGLGAVLLTLVLAGTAGCSLYQGGGEKTMEADGPAPERAKTVNAWGEVRYDKVYDISIDFPSSVTAIDVKEGDPVSMGETLMTLDMAEYQGSINKLQQQLSAIGADIGQTQKDIGIKREEYDSGSKAELKLLQNSLDRAKKEVENAEEDVRKYQSLYEVGAISEDAMDQYVEILDQRKKALKDVEDNIEKTKRLLQEELDQLELALKTKQAQEEQIRIDLNTLRNRTGKAYLKGNRIVSCVERGIVQNIGVSNATKLGVQSTPTRVLELIDMDSLTVSAEVQEEFIGKIALGQTAKIVPASDKGLSIPGEVIRISNVAVEKDGKRIVKVEVKPQDERGILKPGYSADVYFPME